MELPKIRGKALTCVKVLYGLITTFVFGLIALYWFLGVIFTPLFAHGLISESSMEALIPISLVVFGGFSLACFAALNHQVLVNEIRLSEISTIHIGATTIGCVICNIFLWILLQLVFFYQQQLLHFHHIQLLIVTTQLNYYL